MYRVTDDGRAGMAWLDAGYRVLLMRRWLWELNGWTAAFYMHCLPQDRIGFGGGLLSSCFVFSVSRFLCLDCVLIDLILARAAHVFV